jgi:predicted DNA-binding transcriptional regulator AlpA
MGRLSTLPSNLAPRLIKREAAAEYVNVSPNTFDEMVEHGLMPRPRIVFGRRKAWDVRELDIATDALPHDGDELVAADEGWN